MGPALIFGKLIGERLAVPVETNLGATAEIVRPRRI
jgi:hypothetical protein